MAAVAALKSLLADVLGEPFEDATSLGDGHHVITNVIDRADHE